MSSTRFADEWNRCQCRGLSRVVRVGRCILIESFYDVSSC